MKIWFHRYLKIALVTSAINRKDDGLVFVAPDAASHHVLINNHQNKTRIICYILSLE